MSNERVTPEQLAEAKRIVREPKYETERYCCTVCAKKKKCHVCGAVTEYACSDCAIDLRMAVYVCATTECRHAHEEKCPATLRARIETLEKALQEIAEFNTMNFSDFPFKIIHTMQAKARAALGKEKS